jgi:hypothetical protein
MFDENLIDSSSASESLNLPVVLTERERRDGWVVSLVGTKEVKVLKNERTRRILTGEKRRPLQLS